jgi:hypothetical protein
VQRHEIGGSTKLEEKVQMVSEAELVEMHQAAAARWERHYAGKNPDGRETANKKVLMPAWLKDSFSQPVQGTVADYQPPARSTKSTIFLANLRPFLVRCCKPIEHFRPAVPLTH